MFSCGKTDIRSQLRALPVFKLLCINIDAYFEGYSLSYDKCSSALMSYYPSKYIRWQGLDYIVLELSFFCSTVFGNFFSCTVMFLQVVCPIYNQSFLDTFICLLYRILCSTGPTHNEYCCLFHIYFHSNFRISPLLKIPRFKWKNTEYLRKYPKILWFYYVSTSYLSLSLSSPVFWLFHTSTLFYCHQSPTLTTPNFIAYPTLPSPSTTSPHSTTTHTLGAPQTDRW